MILYGLLHNQRFDTMTIYTTKALARQAMKRLVDAHKKLAPNHPHLFPSFEKTENSLLIRYDTIYSDHYNIVKLRAIEPKRKADVKA
jgi:hypothetical protein